MGSRILVLGAGRVGGAIALDLAANPAVEVTVVDRSEEALEPLDEFVRCHCRQADLDEAEVVRELAEEHDLVVNAVPGRLGLQTLQAVLEAGRDAVDISFMPEDPRSLDGLARERGVTAVVDAGVAPGLSHLIVGRLSAILEKLDEVTIQVGGLPEQPEPPWFYAAVFSPADVLEEYLRPARLIENGRIVHRDPLETVESVEFPGLGVLEAFDSDGLRTLLDTVKTGRMREQTLRYPGHLSQIKVLQDEGLLSREPITAGHTSMPQLAATAAILAEAWELPEDQGDLTVMRVLAVGRRDGVRERHVFEMLDRWDRENDETSMARTTGYTCTALVNLLVEGRITHKGVVPPEMIGRDEALFDAVLQYLAERGITLTRSSETI